METGVIDEAQALVDMGAKMIDTNTVIALLAIITDLENQLKIKCQACAAAEPFGLTAEEVAALIVKVNDYESKLKAIGTLV